MQKIILTKKTMGTIINKMKKMLDTAFEGYHGYDLNVLSITTSEMDECGDIRNGQLYCTGVLFESNVKTHWMYKEPEKHMWDHRGRKDITQVPMIHMKYGHNGGDCFYHGDVFYFFGGNKILVDKRNIEQFRCFEKYDRIFSIFIRKNEFNTRDEKEKWNRRIESEKEFAKRYEQQYWEDVERDMAREMGLM